MGELDDTYEGKELLEALGLPTGNLPVKRRRLPDYKTVEFFDYEGCFYYYTKRIMNIRQAKVRGEVIVAKPVLLLALIDGISENVFTDNAFELNDWLEDRYVTLMRKYMQNSQFTKVTGIENPFWHLSTDGFWTLQYWGEPKTGTSPSKAWLKENVEYAYFDESLWILLQNKVWRMKLRDYIVEHKLTDDFWSGRMAAEGLGAVIALLFAA